MTLNIPSTCDMGQEEMQFFKAFLQGMTNRRIVGGMRYGPVKTKQHYLTRLSRELAAYKQTGNMEQLINIAVYCYLEAYAPQNKKFHFDPTIDSVTRKDTTNGKGQSATDIRGDKTND